MFRMLGNTAELIRYKISYAENGTKAIANCISEEHKNEVESNLRNQSVSFNTEEVDQTGNEWFNGLKFSSYDEALITFNGGEQAYKSILTTDEKIEQLQRMIADLVIKDLKSEGAIV